MLSKFSRAQDMTDDKRAILAAFKLGHPHFKAGRLGRATQKIAIEAIDKITVGQVVETAPFQRGVPKWQRPIVSCGGSAPEGKGDDGSPWRNSGQWDANHLTTLSSIGICA